MRTGSNDRGTGEHPIRSRRYTPDVRISCIMPTRDRAPFVPLALEWFDAQDWPDTELVVVDDGDEPVGALVERHPRARYLRAPRCSIGAKRNLAVAHATGALVAHWDDDDWSAPDRLSRQAAPILAGTADICGFDARLLLHLPTASVWGPAGRRRKAAADMPALATILWRRALWEAGARYPDQDVGEDAVFLAAARRMGARLRTLRNDGAWAYGRHGGNTWRFEQGRALGAIGWGLARPPPALRRADVERMAAAAAACGRPPGA